MALQPADPNKTSHPWPDLNDACELAQKLKVERMQGNSGSIELSANTSTEAFAETLSTASTSSARATLRGVMYSRPPQGPPLDYCLNVIEASGYDSDLIRTLVGNERARDGVLQDIPSHFLTEALNQNSSLAQTILRANSGFGEGNALTPHQIVALINDYSTWSVNQFGCGFMEVRERESKAIAILCSSLILGADSLRELIVGPRSALAVLSAFPNESLNDWEIIKKAANELKISEGPLEGLLTNIKNNFEFCETGWQGHVRQLLQQPRPLSFGIPELCLDAYAAVGIAATFPFETAVKGAKSFNAALKLSPGEEETTHIFLSLLARRAFMNFNSPSGSSEGVDKNPYRDMNYNLGKFTSNSY